MSKTKRNPLLLLTLLLPFIFILSGCVTGSDALVNKMNILGAQEIQKTESLDTAKSIAAVIEQGSVQLEQAVGKADLSIYDQVAAMQAITASKEEHESLSFFGNAAKQGVAKLPFGDWAMHLFALLFGAGGIVKSKLTSKKLVSVITGAEDVFESMSDKDYAQSLKIIMAKRQDAMGVGQAIKSDIAKLKASGLLKPSK